MNPSAVRVGVPKAGVSAADKACPVTFAVPSLYVVRVDVTVTLLEAPADSPDTVKTPVTGSMLPALGLQV